MGGGEKWWSEGSVVSPVWVPPAAGGPEHCRSVGDGPGEDEDLPGARAGPLPPAGASGG